jgi:hypothetical protein
VGFSSSGVERREVEKGIAEVKGSGSRLPPSFWDHHTAGF